MLYNDRSFRNTFVREYIHLTVTVYDLFMQELDAHSRVPIILEYRKYDPKLISQRL